MPNGYDNEVNRHNIGSLTGRVKNLEDNVEQLIQRVDRLSGQILDLSLQLQKLTEQGDKPE
jgi:chaperonin cofactor prefoldin